MSVQALTCPRCGGNIKPSDRVCPFCGAALEITTAESAQHALRPQQLDWLNVGDYVRVAHPGKGQETAQVAGKVIYQELWQQVRGGPWVPTGGAFAGFWLETGALLLNWQDRYYILDQSQSTSDVNIARDFAPYAHQFGQSDQKAKVNFNYNSQRWLIVDIGKFNINAVLGDGIDAPVGAIGRFIHASGDGGRGLVVEDYESSGGGQDTVWQGYAIKATDVQKG